MATSQRVFSAWLRDDIAPILREHGFQGSGQDYHRRIDRNWAAINFQRARYSTADELKFTVNLGTASAVVIEADRRDPDDAPREVLCHWRNRIGAVMPQHRDTWWKVRADADRRALAELTAEVGTGLMEHAIPTLEQMATDEAILVSNSRDSAWMDLAPAELDVVGPILREIGPPGRFRDYIEVIDRMKPPLDVYDIYARYPPRMGPARTAKALANLGRVGFGPRVEALLQLAFASPTPEVLAAVRPQLQADDPYIQGHAAFAIGHLGDAQSAPRLAALIESGIRYTCCTAAIASLQLAPRMDDQDLAIIKAALSRRRADAVGHERPLLAHVQRQVNEVPEAVVAR